MQDPPGEQHLGGFFIYNVQMIFDKFWASSKL